MTFYVKQGVPLVSWQLVLTCKAFNPLGMYINEANFGTNIRVQTESLAEPCCDPTDPNDLCQNIQKKDKYRSCAKWASDNKCDWLISGKKVKYYCSKSCPCR